MGTAREVPARLVFLRGVVFAVLATILTALGWFIATVLLVVDPRRAWLSSRAASLWGRSILVVAGGSLEVEGAERLASGEARLLVANHASYLDPAVMLAVFPGPLRFFLKKELGHLPFIGWYTRAAGHFLLDRSSARAGHDLIERAMKRARRYALSPIVFPEGTRSRDGRLQVLKPGAFQLAIGSGVAVQPVAILGTHPIMPKGSLGPRRGGTIRVRIGEPIPTADLEGSAGRKHLAVRVREALLALGVPDGDAELTAPR
ncbi:MAG: lysophospholipid acyltransferase family protein [Planctomycetota bacterium]|jgi:1-acyl-sn-glycerol-3-phosphate acyltransferase